MPELPEVEHARLQLERAWAGRVVREVEVVVASTVRHRLSSSPSDRLDGATEWMETWVGERFGPIRRHGKRLGWSIGEQRVLCHLGMTGRWIARPDGAEVPHGRLRVRVAPKVSWWFEDSRRFGGISPCLGPLDEALARGLGPDALVDRVDGPALKRACGGGRTAIKSRIMDQARLAGVGNIQATEALWRAGIHPESQASSLDDPAWARLAGAIGWTIRRTLADAGDDELVYLSKDKQKNPFLVYGRVGEPCPTCTVPISTVRLGGRTSPYCAGCQVRPG